MITPHNNKPRRNDRLIKERVHDSYKMRRKPAGPVTCPDCGAVFARGRWSWAEQPADAKPQLCAACRRTRDRCPAAWVHIAGDFFGAHRDDLEGLIRQVEAKEKGEHPLHRIMAIQQDGPEVVITTTDAHLARAIGDALFRAHEGQLDYDYEPASPNLRVKWTR